MIGSGNQNFRPTRDTGGVKKIGLTMTIGPCLVLVEFGAWRHLRTYLGNPHSIWGA